MQKKFFSYDRTVKSNLRYLHERRLPELNIYISMCVCVYPTQTLKPKTQAKFLQTLRNPCKRSKWHKRKFLIQADPHSGNTSSFKISCSYTSPQSWDNSPWQKNPNLFWMRSRVTEPLLHKNMLMHTHGLPMAETLDNARNNTSNKNTSFMFRFVYGRAEILTLVNFFSKHASGVKKK